MLQPPNIIDIEASGLGAGSYPIEIGCVLGDGRSYCALVQPPPDWVHWDPAAEACHGISRSTLLEHGLPPLSVAARLNSLLRWQTVYSDAWGHDYDWLAKLHEAAGVPPEYRLEPLTRIMPEIEAERWRAIQTEVALSLEVSRRRASHAARVLQTTWLCVMHGDSSIASLR